MALVKEKPGEGHVALKDVPEPSAGAGQVKIGVRAAGVCGSDLHIFHDDIKLNLRPPVVMGHEFSGVVEEVGADVTGFKPGDRVVSETTFRSCGVCRHCTSGAYNLCPEKELIGYVHNGCFANSSVVPAERVHVLPDTLSFEEGALCEPLACCVHAVLEQTTIKRGEVVVVAGVGGVGLLAAQAVRASGANVVICGTSGDGERFGIAEGLGFDRMIDVESEDAVAAVRKLTGGEGPDVFLECSGAPPAADMGIAMLRRGGRYCQVGLFGELVATDLAQVAYKELELKGGIGSVRSSWRTALALLESGQVKVSLLMSDVLPLRDWEEAFTRFEQQRGVKLLLRPEQDP